MLFADLRGWSSFVDAVEPEELMRVLGEFHDVIGRLVKRFDATVGFLEGDGVQLFFNDPIEIPDAALRAVQLGCALREEMAALMPSGRSAGTTSTSASGSPSATRRVARSASTAAPTTPRSGP